MVYLNFDDFVDGIAELTSPGVYNILSCNEVFDTDTILACATSGTSEPSWEYKAVQTDTYSTVSATTWDSTAGISTLTITTTQQGYYTCTLIAGETMYTVAILNPDVTIGESECDISICIEFSTLSFRSDNIKSQPIHQRN